MLGDLDGQDLMLGGVRRRAPDRRNKAKTKRFFAEIDGIKQTHPHIAEWFSTATSASARTEIIEQCFTKDQDKRGWILDVDKP